MKAITVEDVREIKDMILAKMDLYENDEEMAKANGNFIAGLLDFQDALIAWIKDGEV